MKFSLTFVGAAILFISFFYFYPAEIFESKIVDSNGTITFMDLSLQSIFWFQNLPESLVLDNIASIQPSTSGWLILFICTLGLPLMIAYRTTVERSPRPKKEIQE